MVVSPTQGAEEVSNPFAAAGAEEEQQPAAA
jgi:hypothetical protein